MEKSINKWLTNIIGYDRNISHSVLTLVKFNLTLNSHLVHFFVMHKKLFFLINFADENFCDFMKGLMLHEWGKWKKKLYWENFSLSFAQFFFEVFVYSKYE